jgi:hypothetical protein
MRFVLRHNLLDADPHCVRQNLSVNDGLTNCCLDAMASSAQLIAAWLPESGTDGENREPSTRTE